MKAPAAAGALATARFATDDERAKWDELLAAGPQGGEVWASDAHIEAKRFHRYSAYRVMVDRRGQASLPVSVLAKRVPLLGEWWMALAGPEAEDLGRTVEAVEALARFARDRGAFLLKIEPRVERAGAARFHELGFLATTRRIPNDSTVIVDLSGSEQEIYASFNKKARNAISRARREGVEIEAVSATDENCARMFALLAETSVGRFELRPEAYYRGFWQTFERHGTGQMFFAVRRGDVANEEAAEGGEQLLAAAYVIRLGAKSTYKDGASVRDKQAYGVSHLLQWEAMRWAKGLGATTHDLCGAPPSDRADDPTHELHGIGKFKQSFSVGITDYVGALELPLKPRRYRLWVRLFEPVARRWSLANRGDPYY